MKKTYTKKLADDMAKEGVALRASGAYVHRSFDADELARLEKAAKQNIEFEKELRVVIASGRGCLVREARLSLDGTMVRYIGGIVSLKLLGGEALRHSEFAGRLKGLPGIKIRIAGSGDKRMGILFGSLEDPYAMLVDTVNGKMRFTDIETQERSNNSHVLVEVTPMEDEDIVVLEAVRQSLKTIAEQAK